MDPFQAALDAIFNGPGSLAASYQHSTGDFPTIRVLLARPDEAATFRASRIVQATYEVSVRKSEIYAPIAGAELTIPGQEFPQASGVITDRLRLTGDPMIDAEGLTWNCGAEPI
ncbi:head-tail joining protein [Sphingomonas sp. OTU376]|uniref:head-tail joining protein n=1 Tax=Sphingomonas sp. OTU376 TaxID=3043863 RepID=UPI00313D2610